jgi:hypothetical protein
MPLTGKGYINAADPPYNAGIGGDDTPKIQQALNDAASTNAGEVFLPAGTYNVNTHLSVPANTALIGVAPNPWESYGPGGPTGGTVLRAIEGAGSATGTAFITLAGVNAGVDGLTIWYPNQVTNATPVAYPYTIRGMALGVSVQNVFLLNPYQGIDFASYPSGRHLIRNVWGQPLYVGIFIDQSLDVGRIQNIHFWWFWTGVNDNVLTDWVLANGTAMAFGRADWEMVENVFCFGYAFNMIFAAYGGAGQVTNAQMNNIAFDYANIGIYLADSATVGVFISNLNVVASTRAAAASKIGIWHPTGTDGTLIIRGGSFWGNLNQPVVWSGTGTLTLSESRFQDWNATTFFAVNVSNASGLVGSSLTGTVANIHNNYFVGHTNGRGIWINGDPNLRAVVMGNEMQGNILGVPAAPPPSTKVLSTASGAPLNNL